MRWKTLLLLACFFPWLLAACATVERSPAPTLEPQATWAIAPFANYTETPLAGSRAQAVASQWIAARVSPRVVTPPPAWLDESLFEKAQPRSLQELLQWAKGQGARYLLTGSVSEWRYKVGVDGEPAVGLTVTVYDVASGARLYSAVGGKSGYARESVAAVAQKLTAELLAPLATAP
ncbi:penicillin-binding protein activator LpoB [Thiobacter aerophilum]|uniref:Penicillin-binding protein activator LpoB n=1 Tax=Thiobacter aerophilum TaxID=3121275 RepID=A0ABV0EG61_9BURK